ncbi:Intron-binding protein aquarius [Galdieria sulphuraria]|nr:Intron-binding protein aquarius [Galdieria sulphuraria]
MKQEEQLVQLAKKTWLEKQQPVVRDEKLVEYLFPFTRDTTSASILDNLEYLRLYLWPCYCLGSCSDLHVFSIVNMVCESHKVTENGWDWITDEEIFGSFFRHLLSIPTENCLDYYEQERRVFFLLLAFRRQDLSCLRKHTFPLISLPLFVHISPDTRSKQLERYPQLKKMWRKVEVKKQDCQQRGTAYIEADFIPYLARQVEKTLEAQIQIRQSESAIDSQQYVYPLRYLERILELFVELLWQLPTRRFFCVFLNDYQLDVSLKLLLRKHQDWDQLSNLQSFVDMLYFYKRFPIDNDNGEPLTREELLLEYHDKILSLQKWIFKHVPKLKELAVVGASQLTNTDYLSSQLYTLTEKQLIQLAIELECLPYRGENIQVDSSLLVACIVDQVSFYPWKYETFYNIASNPTEKDIWDDTLSSLEEELYLDEPLALPKLNLQYLSMGDFVLRHFTLFRMEAAYSIRQEMEDALERLNPCLGDMGRTQFRGWSRMMIPLNNLSIYERAPTRLDSEVPQYVKMDISYDLETISSSDKYRQEWDHIMGENDILFLLSIQKPMDGTEQKEQLGFIERYGIVAVRTFQVIGLVDIDGNEIPWMEKQSYLSKAVSTRRTIRGYLDATQFQMDQQELQGLYSMDSPDHFNLVMRRKPQENNFRGVLDTLKDVFLHYSSFIPKWLLDTLLGYGEWESSFECFHGKQINLEDTFISLSHMESCLKSMNIPSYSITKTGATCDDYWQWHFYSKDNDNHNNNNNNNMLHVEAVPFEKEYLGPYPIRKHNQVPFTVKQVEAILHGMKQGLSLIVGPPGTGKTDVAVQIISNLYHSFPEERILLVTHSNNALNDIFVKILQRDIDPKDILRLGHGEEELGLMDSFSREGRVNYMLQKRLDNLQQVQVLADSMLLPGDYGYSCENALLLYHTHILPLKREFFVQLDQIQEEESNASWIAQHFPFYKFFSQHYSDASSIFRGDSYQQDLQSAKGCFRYLDKLFEELEAFRALELLRNQKERGDYVLLKQAKIIAMTCTHASIRRKDYLEMGLKYDTFIMEESAQVLEVETFIPMILQKPDFGCNEPRLKRCILLGDHHQLPPVVKSRALAKYCNLQQSLYTRLLRLGASPIVLDVQGRARPSIADIYRWCYPHLKDLTTAMDDCSSFQLANPGFRFEYQWISVGDWQSESQPVPYFYQNLVEAEWIAAVYQYMRLLGYPREKISVLTTYKGQKELLKEVLQHRIAWNPSLGMPKTTTVDKYQGQQNDYILLSMVRTKHVGHIRDIRRWVVATSRARLGLYIFGYLPLFQQYPGEWKVGLELLSNRCHHELQLVTEERYGAITRKLNDIVVGPDRLVEISDCADMAKYIQQLVRSHPTWLPS